jgi:hypothetical protein
MKNTLFNEFVEDGVGISSGGGTVAVERPGLEGPSGGAPNADQGPESDSFEEIDLAVADPFSGPTGELTPDAIAAAVERGMSRGAPQQQQVQERRAPTREEQEAFMAQMGRPQVTPEFINNLMNADIPADQKLAAMQQLLDGTAQYAMRVAQTAFESQLSRIQGEYQPLVQQTQQQAHKEYLGQIEQNYPSLSGHGRIVNLAIQELKRTGYYGWPHDQRDQTRFRAAESKRRWQGFGSRNGFRAQPRRRGWLADEETRNAERSRSRSASSTASAPGNRSVTEVNQQIHPIIVCPLALSPQELWTPKSPTPSVEKFSMKT